MTTPPDKAISQRGGTARKDKRRVRMAWFEHGFSRIYFEAQGSGDPILIIPEFGGSIEQFSDLRDALVMKGYQVIAADLPGSGRSEPQPRAYTASYFEEDALAFTALLQHLSSEPAHLVGFGNGGETCLLIADMMPEVVQSVVAYGAAGTINDPEGELREAISNVVDHPIPSLQQFREYLVSTYGEEQARAMTQSVVAAWSTIIKQNGGDISRSKADKIGCPVLLIAGEHDMFAPPELVCVLAAHIRTTEMLVVENVEHFMYSDCHEWLSHTILEWLGKQPG
jgi:pimeloyl-ACP methyl ester carboxylesterase